VLLNTVKVIFEAHRGPRGGRNRQGPMQLDGPFAVRTWGVTDRIRSI
jgi:hypothetical protein